MPGLLAQKETVSHSIEARLLLRVVALADAVKVGETVFASSVVALR